MRNAFIPLVLFAHIHYVFISQTHADDHEHKNYKFYSDADGRLTTRYFDYSFTEFEHAIDDDRCTEWKPYTDRQIMKDTQHGTVRGIQIGLCDTPGLQQKDRPGMPGAYGSKNYVNMYLGIPYANPPVTPANKKYSNDPDLKLKPPTEKERFGNIDATRYKPACPQNARYFAKGRGINTTDDDCLYLNIFTPAHNQFDKPVQEKYPVMFYIHGDNWDHGSGALFPPHILSASQRVVVVTFNYRLGHLGFLSTGDLNSVGNYGILDQISALKWVYENIDTFDGDPKKITVFGSGSGAASASLLAISPLSKRYVKRVIAQNGSPVAEWAVISDHMFMFNSSQILGEALGCQIQDLKKLVECVATRSKKDISTLKIKPRKGWLPFGPVVDNFTESVVNRLLPNDPADLLNRGVVFQDGFAFMGGVSRDAGFDIFMDESATPKDLDITDEKFRHKIRDFMRLHNYSVNANGIFDAIYFMYKPSLDSSNKTLLRQAYIQLLTDRYYVASLERTLDLMLKNRVPTYAYVLNYTLQGYAMPVKDIVAPLTDYLLLSGAPFMNPKYYPPYLNLNFAKWTDEDRNMSQFMMEAWANFAKEGNPTPTRLFNTILWEPSTPHDLLYLNMNGTNTTSDMLRDYHKRESRFWNQYLPFFIDREPPTLPPTLAPGVAELRYVTSALWGSTAITALLLLIAAVFCVLYCRIRRYDEY